MPLKTVLVFKVPALAPVTFQALVPSVAANVSVPPPPVMLPLKTTPDATVKVSLPAPPFKLLIALKLIPDVVTALVPVMAKVFAVVRPVNVLLFAAFAVIVLTPLNVPPIFVAMPMLAPVSVTVRLVASVASFSVAASTLPVTLPPALKFTVPVASLMFLNAVQVTPWLLPLLAVVASSR